MSGRAKLSLSMGIFLGILLFSGAASLGAQSLSIVPSLEIDLADGNRLFQTSIQVENLTQEPQEASFIYDGTLNLEVSSDGNTDVQLIPSLQALAIRIPFIVEDQSGSPVLHALELGRLQQEPSLGLLGPSTLDGILYEVQNSSIIASATVGTTALLFNQGEQTQRFAKIAQVTGLSQEPPLIQGDETSVLVLRGVVPSIEFNGSVVLPELFSRQSLFFQPDVVYLPGETGLVHGNMVAGITGPLSTRVFYTALLGGSVIAPHGSSENLSGVALGFDLRVFPLDSLKLGLQLFGNFNDFILPRALLPIPATLGVYEMRSWFASLDVSTVLYRASDYDDRAFGFVLDLYGFGKTSEGLGLLPTLEPSELLGFGGIGGSVAFNFRLFRDLKLNASFDVYSVQPLETAVTSFFGGIEYSY